MRRPNNIILSVVVGAAILVGTMAFGAMSGEKLVPNDPLFLDQWGLKNGNGGFDINATKAWALERGNKTVVIAVIDSGIDYTHPDLANNMWVNPGEIPGNGIDDDNNGYIDDIYGINAINGTGDPMDDNGHGTHVAGVIGAEGNNGIGISGVMHKVSLIACKFIEQNGVGTTSGAIKCLDYVADLARRYTSMHIVATNNAWGSQTPSNALLSAIKKHEEWGILFVTSSGGERRNIDGKKTYPAGYNAENIIVVSSMNQSGQLSAFANYGPKTVHLASPGGDILSTALLGTYQKLSGSPATGFVSGIIGLMKAQSPLLTFRELKAKLLSATSPLVPPDDTGKVMTDGYANAFNALTTCIP